VAAVGGTDGGPHPPRSRPVGYACFVPCALIVIYGIYLAIPSLHKVFS
jgi:hypothetical protein